MREIKFRAWDGESMRYDITGVECDGRGVAHGVFIDGDFYALKEHMLGFPIAKIMQYVGFTDKSGKKMYEGDIVSIDNRGTFISFEWMGCGYFFDDGSPISDYSNIEVVGNIHENPELLK